MAWKVTGWYEGRPSWAEWSAKGELKGDDALLSAARSQVEAKIMVTLPEQEPIRASLDDETSAFVTLGSMLANWNVDAEPDDG